MATNPGEPEPGAPGQAPEEPGLKSALGLTLLSAATFVLLLATQWAVLIIWGPEERTDALFAGLVLPQTLLAVFSVSLGNVLVPLFAGEPIAESRRHAWGLFWATVGFFSAVSLALVATAQMWVPFLFPGFKNPAMAVTLCRIQLPTLVLSSGAGILTAVLQARRNFVIPELALTLGQATSLAVLGFTASTLGVTGAAWGYVARSFVHLAVVAVAAGVAAPVWPKERIAELWRRWKPLLVGGGFYKTELIVDAFLSSKAAAGGLSLYYLGHRLYGSALEIVRKSFADPVLPVLSIHARNGNGEGFRSLYRRRVFLIVALLVPAYVLFIFVGEPALRVLIGRGGITAENVHTLWTILVALGGVLVAGATGQVVAYAWYARGETRTPTVVGVIGFAVAIALKILCFSKFGIVGLAVAASLHYVGNGLILYFLLERRTEWRTRPA